MFDLAWSEIALIGAVAVLVLGPKELPQAMRTMAKVMRKMRSLTSELQGHMNEIVREAELEEVRQSIQKLSSTNIQSEISKAVDPGGEISAELNGLPAAVTEAPITPAPVLENTVPENTETPAIPHAPVTETASEQTPEAPLSAPHSSGPASSGSPSSGTTP